MTRKFGDQIYNPERIMNLGFHEWGKVVTSESNLAVHDFVGLYPSRGERGVEAHADRGIEHNEPELEHDEPELE